VGEPTERSRSLAPTVEELVAQLTRQTTRVVEQQVSAEESRLEPSTSTGAEEPVAAQAAEEALLTVNFCQPRVLVIHWFRL
jgi:hypothetical protein